jgi:hypothetical protein
VSRVVATAFMRTSSPAFLLIQINNQDEGDESGIDGITLANGYRNASRRAP